MTIKDYDRNDNDTYVEKLSDNILIDTELHMFRNPKGFTAHRSIMGDFSVQSRIAAENNILKFPTASKVGIPKIKDVKVPTFIPMSLVDRYKHTDEQLSIHHKSPIFFDTKNNKFVLMLDHRMIRDIHVSELDISDETIFKIYPDKHNQNLKYIGLLFDNISDIDVDNLNKNGSPFSLFMEAYRFYKMALQGGEKVIVVQFLSEENVRNVLFDNRSSSSFMGKGLTTRQFTFEHAICIRFNDKYYFCDEKGMVIQKSSFFLDKIQEQKAKINPFNSAFDIQKRGEEDCNSLFVVPYTEEQFQLIERLSNKLHSIHNELCDFFDQSTDKNSTIDHPIESISNGSGDFIKLIGNL
jgi:hypothetical protein